MTQAEIDEMEWTRPRVRGDCLEGPRPCPWVSCRYHLGIDVKASGGIIFNFDDPVGDGEHPTCALDCADDRSMTLEAVGALLDSTREWIRQIEDRALARLAVTVRATDPESAP